MVNFTIVLPEELKAEMDKYPDVNWSELTRKSIQSYLKARSTPFPPLEFQIKSVHLTYSYDLMQPTLKLHFKIRKQWDSQLIINKMLFTVRFLKERIISKGEDIKVSEAKEKEALKGVFTESLLEAHYIIKDTYDDYQIALSPPIDLLKRLQVKMQANFWIDFSVSIYAQGFDYPAIQNGSIKVSIDEWKNEIESTTSNFDSYNSV